MTSSPRGVNPIIVLSLSVLAWIILTAGWLRLILGTEVSGSWLVVGLLITLVAVGFVVVIKEFMDAVTLIGRFSGHGGADPSRRPSAKRHPATRSSSRCPSFDPVALQAGRSALGLAPDYVLSNRVRTGGVKVPATAKEEAPTLHLERPELPKTTLRRKSRDRRQRLAAASIG